MGVECLVFANKHTFEIDKVKCKGKQKETKDEKNLKLISVWKNKSKYIYFYNTYSIYTFLIKRWLHTVIMLYLLHKTCWVDSDWTVRLNA